MPIRRPRSWSHYSRQQMSIWGRIRPASANLGPQVRDRARENKTSKIVYSRADARAHYGTVMDAIDAVRTAEVEEVGC